MHYGKRLKMKFDTKLPLVEIFEAVQDKIFEIYDECLNEIKSKKSVSEFEAWIIFWIIILFFVKFVEEDNSVVIDEGFVNRFRNFIINKRDLIQEFLEDRNV